MDEEKTTQEQEAEGAAAAEAGAETAETVAEAEKTTTGTVTDDAGDPEPAEKKSTEKVFTQKEVDDIVKKRLARAAKDSQTAAQMQQTIEAENAALRHSVACYKAGVKAECVEDAVALASKYVDDKTDFDTALTKVLEKYPAFGQAAKKNTSPDMTPKKSPGSDDLLRSVMGLKAKG